MPVLFIARTEGDPVELEKHYNEWFDQIKGNHGRGEDWGIPHLVLHHTCAFSDDAMYVIDVFRDEETMTNLVLHKDLLPAHVRPSFESDPWRLKAGVKTMPEKWGTPDIQILRVAKMLPPLRAVVLEEGLERRPRY